LRHHRKAHHRRQSWHRQRRGENISVAEEAAEGEGVWQQASTAGSSINGGSAHRHQRLWRGISGVMAKISEKPCNGSIAPNAARASYGKKKKKKKKKKNGEV